MIDISVHNLTKFFVIGENLLEGLSFEIQEGECVAVLGRNGCGKTTLFRILTGEIDYDEGEIFINPHKKLGLISQIPQFPQGWTVEKVLRSAFLPLEKLKSRMLELEEQMSSSGDERLLKEYDDLCARFQAGGGYETDVQTDKVCNGLAITMQQRSQLFESLSGGEKTRMNLARLLLEQTDILLLDEPTNHLDLKSVEWLEGYINTIKSTVLVISHDRYFLDRVADRVIEIADGHGEFYSGNYSFYIDEKQARFDLQLKQYQQEQAKLKQLGYTVERMKGWGINNRTLYRRAMSIQHRMERIKKTEKPKTEKTMKASFSEKEFSGDVVLQTKNLAKSFDARTLFSDVNLRVEKGERIALLGDNGTGKTTFLKCLLGEEDCQGKIAFGPTVKWGYLPQIIYFDHPERSLYDTMLYEKNCTPQTARDRLGAFLFQGEDVFKTVKNLSGGEQSRLRLCMLMDEKINLLILDEPTNHLDIASREWVEAAIEEFEGVLIFVSHDRYFIEKFAQRIWVLEDGTIQDYKCDYKKYRSILEHQAIKPAAPSQPKEKREKPKGGTKEQDKLVRRLEREIEKQEMLISQLDEKMQDAGADYQMLTQILTEKETQEAILLDLMTQWEEASL